MLQSRNLAAPTEPRKQGHSMGNQTDRPPCWKETLSVVFLPGIHNPGLIITKQNNPQWDWSSKSVKVMKDTKRLSTTSYRRLQTSLAQGSGPGIPLPCEPEKAFTTQAISSAG